MRDLCPSGKSARSAPHGRTVGFGDRRYAARAAGVLERGENRLDAQAVRAGAVFDGFVGAHAAAAAAQTERLHDVGSDRELRDQLFDVRPGCDFELRVGHGFSIEPANRASVCTRSSARKPFWRAVAIHPSVRDGAWTPRCSCRQARGGHMPSMLPAGVSSTISWRTVRFSSATRIPIWSPVSTGSPPAASFGEVPTAKKSGSPNEFAPTFRRWRACDSSPREPKR